MPVFASTACLPGVEDVAVRVARYADAGIHRIELGAGVEVEGIDPAGLEAQGRTLLVHNYFPPPPEPFVLNLASASDSIRARSVELARRAIDLSAQLGAPFYSIHAGFVTDPDGFDGVGFVFPDPRGEAEIEGAEARFVETLRVVLAHAADRGIDVLVENNVCTPPLAGKLLLQSAAEFERLFDRLPAGNLGVLMDTGHLNVSASTLGFDRHEFIARLANRIRAVHLHDNSGAADEHEPVREGSWILDALEDDRFPRIPLIVESRFDDIGSLASHVEWLESRLPVSGGSG